MQDHQAWYASHGLLDQILIGRVVSPEASPDGFSETTALTFHLGYTPGPLPHDADWDAYVAEYHDSSEIPAPGRSRVSRSPGTTVYTIGSSPGCERDSAAVGLPAGYQARAAQVAAVQLEKAGVRLAFVLNRALSG